MEEYINLLGKFNSLLLWQSQFFGFINYKFLGDGFILIIDGELPTENTLYLSKIWRILDKRSSPGLRSNGGLPLKGKV